jgi:hypothetical protein
VLQIDRRKQNQGGTKDDPDEASVVKAEAGKARENRRQSRRSDEQTQIPGWQQLRKRAALGRRRLGDWLGLGGALGH